MTPLEWFSVGIGVVSVLGVWLTAIAWWHGRSTNQLISDSRERTHQLIKSTSEGTQALLKDMHVSTQDTVRQLGEGQARLGEILDRMDQRADARARDLRRAMLGTSPEE